MLAIRDVRAIRTAPGGIDLVVVKVESSEPGLYGLGCATFTQRAGAVAYVVDTYLKPMLFGWDAHRIEDIWQSVAGSAYWRNGPVLNNALSGIDMALWDLKGKVAGLPLYQLLGGRCRDAVQVYRHAHGSGPREVEQAARAFMATGIRHVRCQVGGYGGTALARGGDDLRSSGQLGRSYDPSAYTTSTIRMFDHLRTTLGDDVELLHDVHERLTPSDAVRFASDLDRFRLFFLEDPLPPELQDWWQRLRQLSTTPMAMGELFNHPLEWGPLLRGQLIDYLRVHVSQIGGITPALKLARVAEASGVRMAFHGPGDVSPVGHAAQVHLDLVVPNFGIQEWAGIDGNLRDVFPGSPDLVNGAVDVSDRPGIGVDIDEVAASRYPPIDELPQWTKARLMDGTAVRP